MVHPRLARKVAPLLLALVLGGSWTLHATPRTPSSRPSRPAAQRGPENLLQRLWGALTSVWAAEGCKRDPNGRCLGAQARPTLDAGCSADPNGGCLGAPVH